VKAVAMTKGGATRFIFSPGLTSISVETNNTTAAGHSTSCVGDTGWI